MKARLISVLLMALFTTLFACKKSEITPTVTPVEEVTMSPTTASLVVGGTTQLTAAVAPESATNKAVSWTSDKKEIATVDAKGVVTAVAAGTATITVTTENGTKTATCAVTVTAKVVAVESVSLDKTTAELEEGGTFTLTATVLPDNAPDKTLLWTSNNAAVATVVNGKVTALKAGKATITATSVSDPTVSGGCEVTVKVHSINPPTADQYVEVDGVKWAKGNLVAKNGKECQVGAPTDYGVYFQFGSLVGWSGGANGDGTGIISTVAADQPALAVQVKPATYRGSTSWPAGYYTDGTNSQEYGLPADAPTTGIGDPCRYYLGGTWRTPTATEYLALIGTDGANTNKGVPLTVNNTALSFPASGYRHYSNGTFATVGSYGYYWSSSVYSAPNSYSLGFRSGFVLPQNDASRQSGYPVRCVSPK